MEAPKSAASYEAILRTHHPRDDYRTDEAKRYTQWMEKFAKAYISHDDLLIELGCAAGKQTFQAEALGAKVVGLDYVFEALRCASTIAADIGSRAGFLRGNYFFIPIASARFDVVLFLKNLVDINYTEAELLAGEICRILKPGGRLILTLPDSFIKYSGQEKFLNVYDAPTGTFKTKIVVPQQGEFESASYFWTCGFAVHTFSRFLSLLHITEMENYTYMMVFEKKSD